MKHTQNTSNIMRKHMRMLPVFLVAVVALILGAAAPQCWAKGKKDAIEFDAVQLFIEYNSTDDDAGIQAFVDAEEWELLRIRDPHGKKILQIRVHGALKELGLTEYRTESGEPSLDEVLALFPEGDYEFEAKTLEGEKLEGTATLSHDLLDPTSFQPSEGQLVDLNNTVITWDEITGADGYQVIVENEDLGVMMTVDVSASTTYLMVPPTFLEPDTEYEAEVLVISPNGNRTITEGTFNTLP